MADRRRQRSPDAEPCGNPAVRRRLPSPPASGDPGTAQNAGDEGIDLISQMPDSVLSCILSFLRVKPAFRAKMLSRRWRHIYPASVSLCFDLFRDDCIESSKPRSHFIIYPENFFSLVEEVMYELKMGTCKLKEFSLRCVLSGNFSDELEWLISRACLGNVEEINFNGAEIPGGIVFPFSSLLESQAHSCSHLRHLRLESCSVPNLLASFGPLTSLRTLVLRDVRFACHPPGGSFNHIPFVAPQLENLTVEGCVPKPNIQRLCAELPRLKALRIKGCHPGTGIYPVESYPPDDIIIGNSDIREFFFTGVIGDVSFSGLNFLRRLEITCHEWSQWTEQKVSALLATLSKGAPRLRALKLGTIPIHYFQLAASYTFKCLKEINLNVYASSGPDVQRLLRFLIYAPFLENLNISVNGLSEMLTASIREQIWIPNSCVNPHLKKASIKRELGVFGTSDLDLALELLRTAGSLELIKLAGVEMGISSEIRAMLNLWYPKVEVILVAPGMSS